jgi:hypothetical protein
MLTGKQTELDSESEVVGQLLSARRKVQHQLDEMSTQITTTIQLGDNAAVQLVALHRDYERAVEKLNNARTEAEKKAAEEALEHFVPSNRENGTIGAGVGLGLSVLLTIATGGAAAPLIGLATAGGGLAGAFANDDDEKNLREKLEKQKLAVVERQLGPDRDKKAELVSQVKADQQRYMQELKTNEQKKLYYGVVAELLLDNGINIARQLNQYAHFNGVSVDDVFNIQDSELRDILDRTLKGQPKATDIDRLVAISDQLEGQNVVTPEIRTLKQFINHVLIPNKTYFDLLSSFADDIRDQDLSTFPPLEILGQKPITFSGRLVHESEPLSPEQEAKQGEELLDRAKAKVAIREQIAGGAVYEIVKDSELPHLKKMEQLVEANEAEIKKYADVFGGIETAVEALEARRLELADQSHGKAIEIQTGEKTNTGLDARINEIRSRNEAKQKASIRGSRVRGALAMAGGVALALLDGGAVSGGVIAHGAHQAFKDKALGALKRGAKDSLHSVTYAVGQEVMTSTENAALDDYMYSLQLQKADLPALRTELDNLQQAIAKVQNDSGFQAILKDEGRRSMVAETLLLRSLIRNGYNNSLEIEELCHDECIASVDDFLSHYEGTRLGLALKKHCHGIADSNDISVMLAEANSLHANPSGHDRVLKDYVEDVMKPNIAAFYSKASKMDVISHSNLTGFGNELHFSSEMQLETNRAVRVLLANEFGASVVGKEDVRAVFDFWLHRHGDRRLYDEKIRDGEMSDEYPDKRVSHVSTERMDRFVDMAKRSVASGRQSFPKIGDMFMRVCAYEYFLPQAIHVGGKDNIFTNYPESPSAYPLVNTVVGEFIQKMSFAGIDDYREQIGERLDNVIAQSFIDFFARVGAEHEHDPKLIQMRDNLKIAANYDDYAPLFDRYTKNITRDAVQRFDLFMDIYRENLEKQVECATEKDRKVLEEQVEGVKDYADGRLNPGITRPGTYEARMRAHDESHIGENTLRL